MQYAVPLRVIVLLQLEYVRTVDNDEDEAGDVGPRCK